MIEQRKIDSFPTVNIHNGEIHSRAGNYFELSSGTLSYAPDKQVVYLKIYGKHHLSVKGIPKANVRHGVERFGVERDAYSGKLRGSVARVDPVREQQASQIRARIAALQDELAATEESLMALYSNETAAALI